MTDGLYDKYDALGLAELVREKEVTPTELLDEAIERVEAANKKLNLLADRYYDFAREQIAKGLPDGPFNGVPFLRKDQNCDIEGLSATCGSMLMKDNKATVTSELAKRYIASGVVIFGATTVPPFSITVDTDRAWYGTCKNPWDTTRAPGGSSSGAAAVVGCGALPMAHGNDGGGSLRIPAAWSGAFSVKPSRGRLPNGPVYTEGWLGFSAEGTITRSVRDCAAMMDATMGRELGSRYNAPQPARSYLEETKHECPPLKIAAMKETHTGEAFHSQHQEALENTMRLLTELGHNVEYAQPQLNVDQLADSLYKTVAVDTYALLEDMGDQRGAQISDNEIEMLIATFRNRGRTVTAKEYAAINQISMEAAYHFDHFLENYDLLLSPTTPQPAPEIGEIYTFENDFDKFQEHHDKYLNLTQVQNVTGQPAMSIPLQWSSEGLPVGMMFVAKYGDESTLFSLAAQLEKAQPWWNHKPKEFS